ncbi:MAG: SH3 domain-containing protein [Clostridiales bacterium]|nr:SH3 domain-containing protein [Clostridiales bacterium]
MKRTLSLLTLIMILFLPMTTSLASFDEIKTSAMSYLTEVYGYLYDELDDFVYEDTQTDEVWGVSYWPKDHPEWVYTLTVNKTTPDIRTGGSPFDTPLGWACGESGVRDILSAAKEGSWFTNWTKPNQAAFMQCLEDNNVDPTTALSTGIANGSITADKAIYEFFTSCFGEDITWKDATKQWREFILTSNGLTSSASVSTPIKGVRTYLAKVDEETSVLYTDFYQEVPAELAGAFGQQQFSGWTCIAGAIRTVSGSTSLHNFNETGLAIFEKEGARQLVMVYRALSTDAWQTFSVGEDMLYTDRDVMILCDQENRNMQRFTIEYPVSDTKTEIFEVMPRISLDRDMPFAQLQFLRYSATDRQTSEGVIIEKSRTSDATDTRYISVTTKTAGSPAVQEDIKGKLPDYFNDADMATFPTNAEECLAFSKILGDVLPDGYGLCSSVHLRAKTSSRSKDLGLYNSGTMVKVLEVLPGNPEAWIKVQIGSVIGYMSGSYVSYTGTGYRASLEIQAELPAASANKDTVIKKGITLLSGKVADIKAGAKMHVLATRGKWLHVSIPSEGMESNDMDINGTYGYIWAEDVTLAPSMKQLTWAE